MITLNSKGRLFTLNTPVVMGILNVTPDSFHKSSRVSGQELIDKAGQMLSEGAGILDIGGQSTRPGAAQIGAEIEAERVIPGIEALRKAFPACWLSIDTYHASVAENAVQAGADIINDVSAGDDDTSMLPLVGQLQVPYIAMHKKGKPEDMQENPSYENVVQEVLDYFVQKKRELEQYGIYDWVLDPGFGFGKSLTHNYSLLQHLETFQILDKPVLVGISRKGMIQKALNIDAAQALNGTTALNMAALLKKAQILRVHDVKEAVECVKLWQNLQQSD